MDALHVACAGRGRYIPHSAAMLHSVLAHRGERPVVVHYLHDPRLDAVSQRRLEDLVRDGGGSIRFLPVPEAAVADLPAPGHFTAAMWYRILLPGLLDDLDRVLYLDADIIVLDSLEPLIGIDLGDNCVAAVTNVLQAEYANRPAALGLDPRSYFNTGVLLMNLAAMRAAGSTQALRAYAIDHAAELLWPDQDAFNVVLGERRLPLHPRWNCTNSVMHFEESFRLFPADVVLEARRHPVIRHFEGPASNKPWHYLCERATRDAYFEHRRQTPWPRCALEEATLTNRLRRRLRPLRRRFFPRPGPVPGAAAGTEP